MSAPIAPASASFEVSESILSSSRSGGGRKPFGGPTGLEILQEIGVGLREKGYEITGLKSRNAFDARLRSSMSGRCFGITIGVERHEGGILRCELHIWRFYSTFDRQTVRKEKIEQDSEPYRKLCLAVDQQVREAFGVEAISWQRMES